MHLEPHFCRGQCSPICERCRCSYLVSSWEHRVLDVTKVDPCAIWTSCWVFFLKMFEESLHRLGREASGSPYRTRIPKWRAPAHRPPQEDRMPTVRCQMVEPLRGNMKTEEHATPNREMPIDKGMLGRMALLMVTKVVVVDWLDS